MNIYYCVKFGIMVDWYIGIWWILLWTNFGKHIGYSEVFESNACFRCCLSKPLPVEFRCDRRLMLSGTDSCPVKVWLWDDGWFARVILLLDLLDILGKLSARRILRSHNKFALTGEIFDLVVVGFKYS